MTTTRFILVKHAMPTIVETMPANQWLLSDDGRVKTLLLAELLQPWQPARIITSHEPKASETGRIVAEKLGLPCQAFDDLHEHDRTNEPYEDAAKFKAKVAAFFAQPDQLVYGRETANATYQRFFAVMDRIYKSYLGQTTVIVAHGTVISLYLARRAGMDGYWLWVKLGLPSYVVFDADHNHIIQEMVHI